jgi:plastocyanin
MMRWILGLAAVALVAAGTAASADAPIRTVTMPGKLYDPVRLEVLVGTTVAWKNDDSTNHTATAENDAFASGYIPPGGTFSYTFTRQGKFEFRCTIHKQMRGEVDVFGLVLAGPEGPVTAGRRIVFAGLAPAGTESVTLRGTGSESSVKPREDGSFALRVTVSAPGSYRAVAGSLASPRVRVLVRPIVRATRGGRVLRVAATPARPGAVVVLEAYDRERFGWLGIGRAVLDRASRARLAIPAGADRVRAVVRGTMGWADAASPGVVVRGGTASALPRAPAHPPGHTG